MNGFSFKGRRGETLGLVLLGHRISSPTAREYEDELPGMDGTVDHGTEWGRRLVELEVELQPADEPIDLRISNIMAWFDPKKGSGPLALDDVPGRVFFAKYAGQLGIEPVARFGIVTIPMKCTDPFAYGPEQVQETVTTASPFSVSRVSAGNQETPPVLVLTNQGENNIHGFTITSEIIAE